MILAFAAASFFFALAETALFSLSKWQAEQLSRRNPRAGGQVLALLRESDDLLATIALGNTFASAGMLAVALWMALNGRWPLVPTLLVLLVVILFGCEVLPKTLAVRRPDSWALRLARLVFWLQTAATPFRRVAQRINAAILRASVPKRIRPAAALNDAEYEELLDLAFQQGTLARSEKEIILQIIQLDRRTVTEVMRPRAQMAAIPDDLPIEEMIEAARRHHHRRLPIYDENPDTIVGILDTRALLLDPNLDLAEAVEIPSFVPETMNLLQLLKSLQRQHRGLAIVLDEFGSTAGIVTMEDILEEVIGQIRGEREREEFVMERLGPRRWRVSGGLRLDDFRREYPALGEVPEV
ncbi:MAG TPA: hemolysin family protein, partial [Verrucomicrobiae bacterium]|nr:hemolysin family protein [Verrucomicrobiae bacterium]